MMMDGAPTTFPAFLACPTDHGELKPFEQDLICGACGSRYPLIDGIPVLTDTTSADHDELEHLIGHPDGHKNAQATFFDAATAAEFETSRPHGSPAVYAWLLDQKLRRAVRDIEHMLPGSTALVVCGGSGMDAEYLARWGADVISSDISIGAARRTKLRAARYGLRITSIVADAERLPFRDQAVDLVTVHDGLHHLESPETALMEMARVARRAVSVNEPAAAALTAAAVRLGLALEHEDAGNRVRRFRLRELTHVLGDQGFRILHAERYAMYYRHVPGWVTRVCSTRLLFPIARVLLSVANRLAGRAGNKLSVVAARRE